MSQAWPLLIQSNGLHVGDDITPREGTYDVLGIPKTLKTRSYTRGKRGMPDDRDPTKTRYQSAKCKFETMKGKAVGRLRGGRRAGQGFIDMGG